MKRIEKGAGRNGASLLRLESNAKVYSLFGSVSGSEWQSKSQAAAMVTATAAKAKYRDLPTSLRFGRDDVCGG
jgi:hypothetical protein